MKFLILCLRPKNVISDFLCEIIPKILRGPKGAKTANKSQREIIPNTVHVVQLGKYLMKINAISAEMKIK